MKIEHFRTHVRVISPLGKGIKMKNLNLLSDQELVQHTQSLVCEEQKLVAQVLDCLEEVFARRLYLKMGYSSMFEFCKNELGYSDGTAQIRIDALKLTQLLPEVKEDILKNNATITQAAFLNKFLRQEKKITNVERPIEEKKNRTKPESSVQTKLKFNLLWIASVPS